MRCLIKQVLSSFSASVEVEEIEVVQCLLKPRIFLTAIDTNIQLPPNRAVKIL